MPRRRPLDRRFPLQFQQRTGSLAAADDFNGKSVDPPALSRVSFKHSLTSGKRRKEGQMGTVLAVGSKAPAFRLPRDGGGEVALADFKGRKLVLYFYPRADTPGCTREAIDFSRLRAQFHKAGTDILGVSADPVPAQDKFKKKHDLTVALRSDETHKMLEAYGAWG